MVRLLLIAAVGLAIHFGSADAASAVGHRSYRYHRSYYPPRYSTAHDYALPGYEYRYYRGRVNNAATYTQMFGI